MGFLQGFLRAGVVAFHLLCWRYKCRCVDGGIDMRLIVKTLLEFDWECIGRTKRVHFILFLFWYECVDIYVILLKNVRNIFDDLRFDGLFQITSLHSCLIDVICIVHLQTALLSSGCHPIKWWFVVYVLVSLLAIAHWLHWRVWISNFLVTVERFVLTLSLHVECAKLLSIFDWSDREIALIHSTSINFWVHHLAKLVMIFIEIEFGDCLLQANIMTLWFWNDLNDLRLKSRAHFINLNLFLINLLIAIFFLFQDWFLFHLL